MRPIFSLGFLAGFWILSSLGAAAGPVTQCTGQAPWGSDGGTSYGHLQSEAECNTEKPWYRSSNEVIIQVETKGFATAFSVHDRLDGYSRHIPLTCEGYGCRDGYLNQRGMYTIPCFDNCTISATGPAQGGKLIKQIIRYDHFSSSFEATLDWDAPEEPEPEPEEVEVAPEVAPIEG
jgi:hypothetical protein